MSYFVLYCAIYLFILSLKAIIAGQQISQKIEQPRRLLNSCFLLVVSYCYCNNVIKKSCLYFYSFKVAYSILTTSANCTK